MIRKVTTFILSAVSMMAVTAIMLTGYGCTSQSPDPGLAAIASRLETDPHRALATLDSLGHDALSEADRHYHDLLMIKARDKAFIRHTSDSLIRDVIAWYSVHECPELRAEALYYGGRVCSDTGDYPAALRFYEECLATLSPADRRLRGCVLANMAYILNDLRLYVQAAECMEQAVTLTDQSADTLWRVYDRQMLGAIYMHLGDYDRAEAYIGEALTAGDTVLPDPDRAAAEAYQAAIKYHKGCYDSARILISGLTERANTLSSDFIRSYAAKIYVASEQPDSAITYIRQLTLSADPSARITAYHLMLDERMRQLCPKESIASYYDRYLEALESAYDTNAAQEALIQTAAYNYKSFERRNTQLQLSQARLARWCMLLIVMLLIAVSGALILALIGSRKKRKLYQAMNIIRTLRSTPDMSSRPVSDSNITALRAEIMTEIDRLRSTASEYDAKAALYESTDIYRKIMERIASGRPVPSGSPLWREMKQTVEALSPDLHATVTRLACEEISESDWRMICMIRLGLSPLQVAQLMSRVKATVSYHRRLLLSHVFHDLIPINDLDLLIRALD